MLNEILIYLILIISKSSPLQFFLPDHLLSLKFPTMVKKSHQFQFAIVGTKSSAMGTISPLIEFYRKGKPLINH